MLDFGLKKLNQNNMIVLKRILISMVLFISTAVFAQNSAVEITTKDGIKFITNSIEYPVAGTYFFKGAEPIVELNTNGTGIYQQHENPKREIIWGFECNSDGQLLFKKGFDSAEYTFFYKYTNGDLAENEPVWNKVEFSVHFNSMKMFINGERVKTF